MFFNCRVSYLFFVLILISNLTSAKSNDSPDLNKKVVQKISWDEWKKKTKAEFKKNSNIEIQTLKYLDSIKFNPKIIELDRKQPEFKLTFDKYFKNIVTTESKKKINSEFKKNKELLLKIEKQFNVNAKIITALWGIETYFGNHIGKMDILRSLASLAYEGRRGVFFTKELKNALIILDKGHFDISMFRGSWAGAFGQTQFMPSTFLKHSIDFDGDNKKNLFKKNDALASGANYLKKVGWNNQLEWGEKVNVVISEKLRILAEKKQHQNIKFWNENGIILKKNYGNNLLRMIIPDSNNNQCYLVSKNFDVILNWNRSNYFALTVFLFSDEIK